MGLDLGDRDLQKFSEQRLVAERTRRDENSGVKTRKVRAGREMCNLELEPKTTESEAW